MVMSVRCFLTWFIYKTSQMLVDIKLASQVKSASCIKTFLQALAQNLTFKKYYKCFQTEWVSLLCNTVFYLCVPV